MLTELVFLLGVGIVSALGIIGILTLIYGKNRPTKFLKSITPGILTVVIAFYLLGRYGIYNYTALAVCVAVTVGVMVVNFMYIAARLTTPLNRIARGLSAGADMVSEASEQVFSASKDLVQSTSQRAAGIEETSSTLVELAATTQQNADGAGRAKDFTEEGNRIVQDVNLRMSKMAQAIEAISSSSKGTTAR